MKNQKNTGWSITNFSKSNLFKIVFLLMIISNNSFAAPVVILDTGHMPNKPGVISASGQSEFEYNFNLTQKIATQLTADEITVIRTGSDGKNWLLTDRTANTAHANLFVSIHHDSMQQDWIALGLNKQLRGFSVFVSGKNPYPQSSLKCALTMGNALLNAGEQPSLYHAAQIKGENRPLVSETFGVHRFDDLIVLKTAKTKAILIEVGVIVNPTEAVRLHEQSSTNQIAKYISDGIKACVM